METVIGLGSAGCNIADCFGQYPQYKVYPEIEKALLNLLHTSGYSGVKFLKKVDFEELYKKNFN